MQELNNLEVESVSGAAFSLSTIWDSFLGGFKGATGGYKAGGILAGLVGGVEGAWIGSTALLADEKTFYAKLKTLIMPFNIPKSNQSAAQQAAG